MLQYSWKFIRHLLFKRDFSYFEIVGYITVYQNFEVKSMAFWGLALLVMILAAVFETQFIHGYAQHDAELEAR